MTKYDLSYWQDRVEHSRYDLPLSNRGISDDEFYAYGGYKILQGEDPTKVVYDKPALGLALIGIFGYYLNNPVYSGAFFGIGILLLTFFIVFITTKNVLFGLATTTFLLLDPLFIYNLSSSALDLPQLFFLLLNILCLLICSDKKLLRIIFVLTAGLSLGVFAQIKIPVLFPVIFVLEIIWLFKLYGKSVVATFLLGTLASLFLGYLPYLLQGYSFIEFLKIQKFILAFYKDSKLPLHAESIWQFLLSGTFPGIVDRVPSKIAEWSIVYPIATVVGILFAIKALLTKKEAYIIKVFSVLLLVSLLVYTCIPSYPRYIILVLPFLYFFMVKALFNIKLRWTSIITIVIAFVYLLINTFYYFHVSPSSFLTSYNNNFSHQYFQDIYQDQIDTSTKKQFTRDAFETIGQHAFTMAKIRAIDLQESPYNYNLFDNTVSVPITITYKTEYLGTFTEKKELQLIKENATWKIKWQWDNLLSEFNPNDLIESRRIVGKRGKIIDKVGTVLAEDRKGYLISLNPELMDGKQEKEMLAYLSKMSTVGAENLQNAYLENPPLHEYIPLFTTNKILKQNEITKLLSYKGLRIEEYPTRIFSHINPNLITNTTFTECCTRIYSSYNYHGNKQYPGIESHYDKQLSGFDGGSLTIRNTRGEIKRVILQKKEKQGQDIILP